MASMTHPVGLVSYGAEFHAWVLDLPGCIAGGRDAEAVAQKLPLAIAEHAAWLQQHGERVDASTAWEVVERIDAGTQADGDGDFCFADDRRPLPREERETCIARLEFARADLLGLVAALPDVILDWAPPRSSVASFDAWAPETRSIRDIVGHVLSFEIFYRDSLQDGPARGIFEAVADAAAERKTTLALLRSLSDEQRARVYHPVRPGATAPGRWTMRKAMRRMLAHERAHAAEIQQRRTWILLDVPDRSAPGNDS